MLDDGGGSCSHISWDGNKATHLLANHGFHSSDFVGTDVMPLFVSNVICANLAS